MSRLKISGLIIVKNEEKNITEVIKTMDFVDEIIVLDSFSTDRTVEILEELKNNNPKIQVYQHVFDDYSSQRNRCLEYAKNPWILFLDADERISESLKQEILETASLPLDQCKSAYYFRRIFYFEKRLIRFSGTQRDKNFRFFQRQKAYYSQKLVHETLEVKDEVGIFKNKLDHYSFDTFEEYKSKMLFYAKLKGKELFLKKKKYNILVQWVKTGFKFFKSYILNLGFLDGKDGIVVCYLQSLSVFETYRSLQELQKTALQSDQN